MNKTFAFGSIVGLLLAGISYVNDNKTSAREWFIFFRAATAIHILLSLGIFHPGYFPKLYDATTSRLNFNGEMLLFSGALSALLFASRKLLDIHSEAAMNRIKLAAVFTAASHVFFLGYTGWLTPAKWPATIPPISMLCFAMLLVIFGLQVAGMWKKE